MPELKDKRDNSRTKMNLFQSLKVFGGEKTLESLSTAMGNPRLLSKLCNSQAKFRPGQPCNCGHQILSRPVEIQVRLIPNYFANLRPPQQPTMDQQGKDKTISSASKQGNSVNPPTTCPPLVRQSSNSSNSNGSSSGTNSPGGIEDVPFFPPTTTTVQQKPSPPFPAPQFVQNNNTQRLPYYSQPPLLHGQPLMYSGDGPAVTPTDPNNGGGLVYPPATYTQLQMFPFMPHVGGGQIYGQVGQPYQVPGFPNVVLYPLFDGNVAQYDICTGIWYSTTPLMGWDHLSIGIGCIELNRMHQVMRKNHERMAVTMNNACTQMPLTPHMMTALDPITGKEVPGHPFVLPLLPPPQFTSNWRQPTPTYNTGVPESSISDVTTQVDHHDTGRRETSKLPIKSDGSGVNHRDKVWTDSSTTTKGTHETTHKAKNDLLRIIKGSGDSSQEPKDNESDLKSGGEHLRTNGDSSREKDQKKDKKPFPKQTGNTSSRSKDNPPKDKKSVSVGT